MRSPISTTEKLYGSILVPLFEDCEPWFSVEADNGEIYDLYEEMPQGEIARIFRGMSKDKKIVILKEAVDDKDDKRLESEYKILSKLNHPSLPKVYGKAEVDNAGIVMEEVEGISMNDLMREYPNGVPAEHVMWMLERLLSVVGYLHSNKIVHGNIKPDNIIINKRNHNVSLVGFSFAIPNADSSSARYKIINDYYTAPEIDKVDSVVLPSSDIYSVGKVAVELLGGDVVKGKLPQNINRKIRAFVGSMISDKHNRPDDAWVLWDKLKTIRTDVFGPHVFKEFN